MAKQQPKPDQKAAESAETKSKEDANSLTKAQELPTSTDTVKVRFLRSHPALAYSPGEVADLPRELHDRYLPDGPFFEAVPADTAAPTAE